MTDRYSEWRDFYAEKVRSWMSLEELRAECGKLTTADAPSPEVLLVHAMHALEELQAEVAERKRVAAAQAELHGEAEERAEQLAEDDAWCAECGVKLETVRPGKHQHPTCSQAQPLTDEALLRQALEALEQIARDLPWELTGLQADTIAALRERLGETKA